ncbi:MAG: aminotransferase class I/II-fold pyridoxal phosphate-dependent enzyme, partial [Bryobacteraceae bacterium]
PFEPSTLAEAAGIGALADKEFLHRSLEVNARGLRLLEKSLVEMGLHVIPPEANFVMVELASDAQAEQMTTDLLKRGIVIRPLKSFGLPRCVRISIGTDEENRIAIEAIERVMDAARV